jgi:hypothetical protein
MRAEDYQRRRQELAGWPVGILSYKLNDRFICEIDNVSPGARVARAEGATREKTERDRRAPPRPYPGARGRVVFAPGAAPGDRPVREAKPLTTDLRSQL